MHELPASASGSRVFLLGDASSSDARGGKIQDSESFPVKTRRCHGCGHIMYCKSRRGRISPPRAGRRQIAAVLTTLLLVPSLGRAQSASFGLYTGVPPNHLAICDSSGMTATTERYTFGPALQVGLPQGFGLEAGLLYKRLAFALYRALPASRFIVWKCRCCFGASSTTRPSAHSCIRECRSTGSSRWAARAPARTLLPAKISIVGGETAIELRHRHTHGFVLGGRGFWAGSIAVCARACDYRLGRSELRNVGLIHPLESYPNAAAARAQVLGIRSSRHAGSFA
jgi:hypothetical protein